MPRPIVYLSEQLQQYLEIFRLLHIYSLFQLASARAEKAKQAAVEPVHFEVKKAGLWQLSTRMAVFSARYSCGRSPGCRGSCRFVCELGKHLDRCDPIGNV